MLIKKRHSRLLLLDDSKKEGYNFSFFAIYIISFFSCSLPNWLICLLLDRWSYSLKSVSDSAEPHRYRFFCGFFQKIGDIERIGYNTMCETWSDTDDNYLPHDTRDCLSYWSLDAISACSQDTHNLGQIHPEVNRIPWFPRIHVHKGGQNLSLCNPSNSSLNCTFTSLLKFFQHKCEHIDRTELRQVLSGTM